MRYLLISVILFSAQAQADVFVLRHAETVGGDSPDPPLSVAGEQRAHNVVHMLGAIVPRAVYATDYARTWSTARPIARAANVSIRLYDAHNPEQMLREVINDGGHVVIVGHSNTVRELVRALGGEPGPQIEHDEYDRLYRLYKTPTATRTSLTRSSATRLPDN